MYSIMLLGLKNWQREKCFKHLAVLKLAMVIKGRACVNHNCSNRTGPVISAWDLRGPLTVVMGISEGRCPCGDLRLGRGWGLSGRESRTATPAQLTRGDHAWESGEKTNGQLE